MDIEKNHPCGILMNKKRVAIVIMILIAAVAVLGYLAIGNSSTNNSNGKIGVVVSIGPEVEFMKAVGGDRVDVTLMVPSTADVHTYEPLPAQLAEASSAKMYVEVGSSIEFETNYMDKIHDSNPNMLVVNASQGIQLIPNTAENEEDTLDSHAWVDPKNAKIMVNNIYDGLVKVDPASKDYYEKNRDQYLHKLDELDKNTTELLKDKQKPILIFHPAFGYYAKDYNITVIGAMINDEEPSPQRLAMLVDTAKQNNIKIVYSEPQYDPKFMQSVASQIGGQVLTVSDLDEHYLENMKNVAIAFSKS